MKLRKLLCLAFMYIILVPAFGQTFFLQEQETRNVVMDTLQIWELDLLNANCLENIRYQFFDLSDTVGGATNAVQVYSGGLFFDSLGTNLFMGRNDSVFTISSAFDANFLERFPAEFQDSTFRITNTPSAEEFIFFDVRQAFSYSSLGGAQLIPSLDFSGLFPNRYIMDISHLNGELIALVADNNLPINGLKSIYRVEPDSLHLITQFNTSGFGSAYGSVCAAHYSCDSSRLFFVEQTLLGAVMHEVDIETNQLLRICDVPSLFIPNHLTHPTELHVHPCYPELDLDTLSSGLNGLLDTICAEPGRYPIWRNSRSVLTEAPTIDSLWVGTGALVVGEELVYTGGVLPTRQVADGLWIVNTTPRVNNSDFWNEVRQQLVLERVISGAAERDLPMVVHRGDYTGDTVVATVVFTGELNESVAVDTTLCANDDPILLSAIAGSGIGSWELNGMVVDDQFDPSTDASGTYLQVLSDRFCGTDTLAVNVSVHPNPNPDLGADVQFCAGDSALVAITNFQNDWQLTWSPGLGSADTVVVYASDVLVVTAVDTLGCAGSDTLEVTALSSITTSDTLRACRGDTVVVSGMAIQADSLLCTNLTSTMNCDSTHCTAVVFTALPSVNAIADNNWFCGPDSATLQIIDPNPNWNYRWQDGVTETQRVVYAAGQYALEVVDQAGCSNSTVLGIGASPIPAFFWGSSPAVCVGDSSGALWLDSLAQVLPGGFSLTLNSAPYELGDTLINLAPGDYVLNYADGQGCLFDTTLTVTIQNDLNVGLGPDQQIVLGDSVFLRAQTNLRSAARFEWQPTPTSIDDNGLGAWVAPLVPTEYTLTLFSESGCSTSGSVFIDVIRSESIFAPNAFSPDGNGLNDYWTIYSGQSVASVKSLRIYDRWGGEVFYTPIVSSGWDGFIAGKAANQGVYVFTALIEYIDGRTEQISGSFTLIR